MATVPLGGRGEGKRGGGGGGCSAKYTFQSLWALSKTKMSVKPFRLRSVSKVSLGCVL